MSKIDSIAACNLKRRPKRAVALILLSVFLCFAILAGSLFVSGLKSGLSSLENRLGADIMVVPYEASTKKMLSNIVLQGNTGYFYMDRDVVSKIEQTEGIGQISEQFFLASVSASCCSVKVQIIGFDPETDFTIRPWVQRSYGADPGYMEILAGNSLNIFPGESIRFFGSDVRVAGKLDETGTYLDSAVYATEETIQTLIRYAKEQKIYDFGNVDPEDIVSCVLINVKEGYSVDEVLNDINIHVRKVQAVKTQTLISDVSGKLTGISDTVSILTAAVWVLALLIMILAFAMISNERKKEFAVLRVLGASRKKLAGILMKEALIISCTGSAVGAVLALAVFFLLKGIIESSLELPFLLPGAGGLVLLIAGSVVVSVLAGSVSAAVSAWRISAVDPALILRGEN